MAEKTAKCPVCNWDITDGGQKVNVDGEVLVVCCDDCAAKAGSSARADKSRQGTRSK